MRVIDAVCVGYRGASPGVVPLGSSRQSYCPITHTTSVESRKTPAAGNICKRPIRDRSRRPSVITRTITVKPRVFCVITRSLRIGHGCRINPRWPILRPIRRQNAGGCGLIAASVRVIAEGRHGWCRSRSSDVESPLWRPRVCAWYFPAAFSRRGMLIISPPTRNGTDNARGAGVVGTAITLEIAVKARRVRVKTRNPPPIAHRRCAPGIMKEWSTLKTPPAGEPAASL